MAEPATRKDRMELGTTSTSRMRDSYMLRSSLDRSVPNWQLRGYRYMGVRVLICRDLVRLQAG